MRSQVPRMFSHLSKNIFSFRLLKCPARFCLCAFVLATSSPRLSGQLAGDWPQFHDADMARWNQKETLLNIGNVSGLSLQWNYNTGVYLSSSPAVANGIVYSGSYGGNVYALNANNGTLLWSYPTGEDVWSSPAVANGVVYFGSFNGNLYALKSDGTLLWSYETNSGISSPAVVNDVVYVGGAFYLYALNAKNGTLLWSYPTGDIVWSSPAVANGVVYFGCDDGNVYALNAKKGTLLWSYPTGGIVRSSPAVANGVVYIGSDDNNVYALNANNGTLLWSYPTGGSVESGPAFAEGIVYVNSEDGYLYALNANNGTWVWSYYLWGPGTSSPALANGVVYIGSYCCAVYALNAETGAVLWSYETNGGIGPSPAVANGLAYFGSANGNIYAFSIPSFLSFPVKQDNTYCNGAAGGQCTPTTARIAAVFDHEMRTAYETAYQKNKQGQCVLKPQKQIPPGYGTIIDFEDETPAGLLPMPGQFQGYGVCGTLYGYTNATGAGYLGDLNYQGNPNSYLWYDSHPGYDYPFAYAPQDNQLTGVYPAINGCVSYQVSAAGAPSGKYHVLSITPMSTEPQGGVCPAGVSSETGFVVFYLHLASYLDKGNPVYCLNPVNGTGKCKEQVACSNCPAEGRWVSVNASQPIAYVGDFSNGIWGGVSPHLHFEVDYMPNPSATPIPIDPYGWCGPPGADPYTKLTGQVNTNLWGSVQYSCPSGPR